MRRRCLYFVVPLMFLAASVSAAEKTTAKRKRHPLAPSLLVLTKEERAKIDAVIDRFILYDSGKLPGADGKKILADFNALGPEATLRLIRGLNKAANLQASCPAVVIGRKLRRLLGATNDTELLDFARDIIGSGVTVRRHMNVIKDLRVACIMRKSYLQRNNLARAASGKKAAQLMSTDELLKQAGKEHSVRLKEILVALEKRQGEKVVIKLGELMARKDKGTRQLAQKLLVRHLYRQKPKVLQGHLKSKRAEVRAVAAYIAGVRNLVYVRELIALLDDDSSMVRQAARGSLVRLSRGHDFGPLPTASDSQRSEAIRNWEKWWQRANGSR